MPTRITMSEVARQAGVSLMTVSRVINHKEDVNAETRKRVLAVIKRLNYRPSGIARSLATKRTRTIGLVIPDVTNSFFADITRGVEHCAYAQGYHVFLCNAEEDPIREMSVIQSLEEKRVDGLILCSSRLDDTKLMEVLPRLPAVVLINRRLSISENYKIESVLLDDEGSGCMATQHLINSGHRKIGFLAGPPASSSGKRRLQGYFSAFTNSGIQSESGWIYHCKPSVAGGVQATRDLLRSHPELTSIFCYNDLVAVGAIQACASMNLRIPGDLAIVGHDDIPLAALVTPSLTTCNVPLEEVGQKSCIGLLNQIHGIQSDYQDSLIPVKIIVRDSAP
jgi:LacI family transcriptional regulator